MIRTNISQCENQGLDHPQTADGYFLYANGKGTTEQMASFESPESETNLPNCIIFDYSIFVSEIIK